MVVTAGLHKSEPTLIFSRKRKARTNFAISEVTPLLRTRKGESYLRVTADDPGVPEEIGRMVLRFHGLALPPEAPGSPPERALLEHELAGRVYSPVVAFPRTAQAFGQLDEALVQRQVVPDGVLPALIRAPEELEALLQKRVDLAERQPLAGRLLYGHY